MRFDVITLFPELFAAHFEHGVTRRAFESGQVDVHLWPLRDFGDRAARARRRPALRRRTGHGAPGRAARARARRRSAPHVPRRSRRRWSVSRPAGRPLRQDRARGFAAGAILLCGRYEGVDQRFIDRHVDLELSIGDYVLSGGELPALVLLDAVARLQPGVLGDARSHSQDSFSDGLLEGPHYSRPERLERGAGGADVVPEVLLSGNHAAIARWRRERALALTAERRPELIEAARAGGRLDADDRSLLDRKPLAGL